MPTLIGNPHY